jgi:Zn finger protein HypA/HybF involved in hydrogenase expression
MIHIKYCRRCKQAFDIETNLDICPKCREELKKEGKGDDFRNN